MRGEWVLKGGFLREAGLGRGWERWGRGMMPFFALFADGFKYTNYE